jgi:hypothetical protein
MDDVVEVRSERRRYGRIRLDESLAAEFGGVPVHVVELAVTGFLVAHEGKIAPGGTRPLAVAWDGELSVQCNVVRSTLYRLGRSLGDQSVYHTGLRIVRVPHDDFDKLRHLIGERVLRALDEQKANARGIPPLSAYMYQPGKGELFRRCELIAGTWRKTETIHPQQPANGFTVSAEVDPYHVDLLCQTWEHTTAEGRRLTQILAELSVSHDEGIPTRRYVP